MKILHTDKDETPALVLDPEKFLGEIQKPKTANDVVIDLSTGQPEKTATPEKKNNKALWGVILLVVVLIIATVIYYFQLKKQRNEYSGN